MSAVLVSAMIALVLFAVFAPGKPYYLIPVPIAFLIQIILEFRCDKIYNAEERNRELAEMKGAYEQYIQEIKEVLNACGIDSPKKRKALQVECKASLEKQAKPYNVVSSNAYSMLIGVPLGAIISTIMYANGDSIVAAQILIIIFGLIVIGVSRAFKTLTYYSDGHFKDRYLLEVLNELEYVED